MNPVSTLRGLGVLSVFVLLAASVSCSCGAEIKALPVGKAAPDFSLKDSAGQEHSLASLKGKIVVLNFCSQECPYSCGVDQDGWQDVVSAYASKGVAFLGVNSHKSTTPEQIQKYAAEKKIPYPILKDTGNTLADAFGASRTPEIFIVDKDGKLAYQGAFDDRKIPEKHGDANYMRAALDDLLAGRAVKTPHVDAWGCSIKRAK